MALFYASLVAVVGVVLVVVVVLRRYLAGADLTLKQRAAVLMTAVERSRQTTVHFTRMLQYLLWPESGSSGRISIYCGLESSVVPPPPEIITTLQIIDKHFALNIELSKQRKYFRKAI